MTEAHARRTDPWTSWAAAKSIDVKPSQSAVLWLVDTGLMTSSFTLKELVEAAQANRVPFSDSRIRTACAELIDPKKYGETYAPMLEVVGTTNPKRGRAERLIRRVQKETLF